MRLDTVITYLLLRPVFRLILSIGFQLEIIGQENIPTGTGSVILAGNHTGFLDGPILVSAFHRPVLFLVAQDVLTWPIIGKLVKIVGIIPVNQSLPKGALRQTLSYLNQGTALCIFPEGKLTRDGQMGAFRSGVAFMHHKSSAPVIPFAIHGGFEAWPWGQWLPVPRKLYIQFGQPVTTPSDTPSDFVASLQQTVWALKTSLENRDRQSQPQSLVPKAERSIS